jgi:hypothetical protein
MLRVVLDASMDYLCKGLQEGIARECRKGRYLFSRCYYSESRPKDGSAIQMREVGLLQLE